MCLRDRIKESTFELYVIYVIYAVAIIFILIGALAPPIGIIDNSIIISVGEIIAMSGLLVVIYAIKHNKEIALHYKDSDVTLK